MQNVLILSIYYWQYWMTNTTGFVISLCRRLYRDYRSISWKLHRSAYILLWNIYFDIGCHRFAVWEYFLFRIKQNIIFFTTKEQIISFSFFLWFLFIFFVWIACSNKRIWRKSSLQRWQASCLKSTTLSGHGSPHTNILFSRYFKRIDTTNRMLNKMYYKAIYQLQKFLFQFWNKRILPKYLYLYIYFLQGDWLMYVIIVKRITFFFIKVAYLLPEQFILFT
jgi:hypothetical protein